MAKQYATLDNLSVFNEYMPKMTPITQAAYDLLTPTEKNDPYKVYFITDATVTGVDIDDTTTALNKVWSSSKVSQSISNPNLLDNPWFTVNQRGQNTYSTTGLTEIYTVDRWSIIGFEGKTVSFDVDSSGITFSVGVNSFRQKLYDIWDTLVGKKLTLSIEYTSTTASGQIGIVKSDAWDDNTVISFKAGHNIDSVTFTAESGTNAKLWAYIPATNTDLNIKAIKLEVGSISTLHLDTAPNYATELAKCQRYFYRMYAGTGSNPWISIGMVWSNDTFNTTVPIPNMRTTPVITCGDTSDLIVSQGSSATNPKTVSSLTVAAFDEFKRYLVIAVHCNESNLSMGSMYALKFGTKTQKNNWIDLSADL